MLASSPAVLWKSLEQPPEICGFSLGSYQFSLIIIIVTHFRIIRAAQILLMTLWSENSNASLKMFKDWLGKYLWFLIISTPKMVFDSIHVP